MSLVWGRYDPPQFYRPLFLPWRCRGVRMRPKPQGPPNEQISKGGKVREKPRTYWPPEIDPDGVLAALDHRPGYRPPAWLWILVAAAFVLIMRALVFGWKGTHP